MSMEKEIQKDMDASIEHLQTELKNLRTSRANPSILDSVKVEIYGTNMRLKDLATVSTPEPRQLLVSPFDNNNVNTVSKAIENANLNLQPSVDGNVIRIQVPPMDESIRKETVKVCKKKGEEAKVSIRETRRKYNEKARKQKQDGEIAEDQLKRFEKMIQENTDKSCKKIDEMCAAKEKDILQV